MSFTYVQSPSNRSSIWRRLIKLIDLLDWIQLKCSKSRNEKDQQRCVPFGPALPVETDFPVGRKMLSAAVGTYTAVRRCTRPSRATTTTHYLTEHHPATRAWLPPRTRLRILTSARDAFTGCHGHRPPPLPRPPAGRGQRGRVWPTRES